jgi:hypothetical protein
VEVGDWSVEAILLSTPDNTEYFVKWTDYGITESSWLSKQNLLDSGHKNLVDRFEKRQKASPLQLIIDQLQREIVQKDAQAASCHTRENQVTKLCAEYKNTVVLQTAALDRLQSEMVNMSESQKHQVEQHRSEITRLKQEIATMVYNQEQCIQEHENTVSSIHNTHVQHLKKARTEWEQQCRERVAKEERQKVTGELTQVRNECEAQLTKARRDYDELVTQKYSNLVQQWKQTLDSVLIKQKKDIEARLGEQHQQEITQLVQKQQQDIERLKGNMSEQHRRSVAELQNGLKMSKQTHATHVQEILQLRSEVQASRRRTQQANEDMARVRRNTETAIQQSKTDVLLAQKSALDSAERMKQHTDQNMMIIVHLKKELAKAHDDVKCFKSQHAYLLHVVQQVQDTLGKVTEEDVGK